MIKYPSKGLFRRVLLICLLQKTDRTADKVRQHSITLYGKIAVFRRLAMFLKVYFQIILNCLQLSGEQFSTCRIAEDFTGICVYPRFNGFYLFVAVNG